MKRWMADELRFNSDEYDDCGEVKRTKLGEAWADVSNWEEEQIPDDVWDAAHEVATWWEARDEAV